MRFTPLLLSITFFFVFAPSNASDAHVNFTQCKIDFFSSPHDLAGAVDRNGNSVQFLNQTEGIRYPQCKAICGTGWERINWSQASTSLTAWLFPWLILVSQLPFQTRGKGHDIFSAFLVIGSPILAMHSLLQTLYNSNWVHTRCKDTDVQNRYGDRTHLKHVAFVLAACQQVPLSIIDQRLLASSIALHQNETWWEELADRLRHSGRRLPESLWPQIALVVGTFILTLIEAFGKVGGEMILRIS